jgi:hypothetical protein
MVRARVSLILQLQLSVLEKGNVILRHRSISKLIND